MVRAAILRFLKNIAAPRDFSFEGIFGKKEARVRRFRLVGGLLKDIPRGRLRKQTREDLIGEITDQILDSPFIRPTVEEQARGAEAQSREIERQAREAAKKVETAWEKWLRELTGGTHHDRPKGGT